MKSDAMSGGSPYQSSSAIIAFQNVALDFGVQQLFARLDPTVEARELLRVAGPSGWGKSTIPRLMSGLLAPTGGEVQPPALRRLDFAFVFQSLRLVPPRNAVENVPRLIEMIAIDTPRSRRVGDEVGLRTLPDRPQGHFHHAGVGA